jgi:PPOX class probable F420-dependent enzyme
MLADLTRRVMLVGELWIQRRKRGDSMTGEQELLKLIAESREAILAVVKANGYPHLSNVFYVWNEQERTARISTTADRVKARILQRDRRAALHVPGPHFWSYAVAECDAQTSAVATTPGDDACRELLEVHSAFYGDLDEAEFFQQMIDARRLVARLRVRRLYGVALDRPPGG